MVDNFFHLNNFDRSLATGMAVMANWSRNGFCYSGKGKIVGLNRASVQVELIYVEGGDGACLAGKILDLPRFQDQTRWTSRNCVQPLDENFLTLLARPA